MISSSINMNGWPLVECIAKRKTMVITNDYNVISFTIERRETKVLKTLSSALAAKCVEKGIFDNEFSTQNGTPSRTRPKKRIATRNYIHE